MIKRFEFLKVDDVYLKDQDGVGVVSEVRQTFIDYQLLLPRHTQVSAKHFTCEQDKHTDGQTLTVSHWDSKLVEFAVE